MTERCTLKMGVYMYCAFTATLITVILGKQLIVNNGLIRSRIFLSNLNFTGYGTIIGNLTANSKTSKLVRVDDKLKQRVLIQFFEAENMSKTEIQNRLLFRFGIKTINLNDPETADELDIRRHLHYNVVERVIIEFLSAEGVRPYTIFKRLRKVSTHGQHLCNVYRWTHKFRDGRTDVANMASNSMFTKGTRRLTAHKRSKYTGNIDNIFFRNHL